MLNTLLEKVNSASGGSNSDTFVKSVGAMKTLTSSKPEKVEGKQGRYQQYENNFKFYVIS